MSYIDYKYMNCLGSSLIVILIELLDKMSSLEHVVFLKNSDHFKINCCLSRILEY